MFSNDILNWFVFIAINYTVLYSSICLAGYLNKQNNNSTLVLITAILVYFSQLTVSILFLGVVVSFLNAYSLLVFNAIVSGLLVYLFNQYRTPAWQTLCGFTKDILSQRDTTLYMMLFFLVLQVVILLIKISVLPPHIWDVFTYHLPPAVEWFQRGEIPFAMDTGVQRINSQALGLTLLNYWFFIFFEDDFLMGLPQFLWAMLLLPLTYNIMRQAGVSTTWAVKFSFLIFFIPIILMQSITSKDQIALNVGFVAALLFIFNYLKTRDNRQLVIAATAFGLVLGYKLVAPVYIAVTLVVATCLFYANHRDLLLDKVARLRLLKTVLVSMVVTVAIGGYWILRNMALYGRPLGLMSAHTPLETGSAGKHMQSLDYLSIGSLFGLDKFLKNIENFIPRIFDYQAMYGADLLNMSGFGPQFVTFGLIGLVTAVATIFIKKYRTDPINVFTYSGILLLLVYFTFYGSTNNYRLFIFFPIIFIFYAAILIYKADLLGNKLYATAINVSMLVIIVWNILNILPPQYTDNRLLKEYISLKAEYRTSANYTRWFGIYHPSFYRLLKFIPPSEPIAYISRYLPNFQGDVADDTWIYLYYDRNWKRKVTYFEQDKYLACNENHACTARGELKRDLLKQGISLVSVCRSNRCLNLTDPDFKELAPGFYYFNGKDSD